MNVKGRKLVTVLKPFNVATTFLSYEENISISAVYPILLGLAEQMNPNLSNPATNPELRAITQFKQKVSSDIKRRWEMESRIPYNCGNFGP